MEDFDRTGPFLSGGLSKQAHVWHGLPVFWGLREFHLEPCEYRLNCSTLSPRGGFPDDVFGPFFFLPCPGGEPPKFDGQQRVPNQSPTCVGKLSRPQEDVGQDTRKYHYVSCVWLGSLQLFVWALRPTTAVSQGFRFGFGSLWSCVGPTKRESNKNALDAPPPPPS